MYVPIRRLGDDSSPPDAAAAPSVTISSAVGNVELSPVTLLGLGLLALAGLVNFTRHTTAATSRKARAVRRALRA